MYNFEFLSKDLYDMEKNNLILPFPLLLPMGFPDFIVFCCFLLVGRGGETGKPQVSVAPILYFPALFTFTSFGN